MVQLCALGIHNELWHTIRNSQTNWQPFHDIKTIVPGHNNLPESIDFISVTGIGESLHVCVAVQNNLFHTIRFNSTGGGWQSGFGDVMAALGNQFSGMITNFDCANVDGNLHICAVTNTGQIIHTIRTSNPPDWRNPENSPSRNAVFGIVTDVVRTNLGIDPSPFDLVSITGP